MTTARSLALSLILGLGALSAACAAPVDARTDGDSGSVVASELRQTLSDSAIKGKLKGILQGVDFMSESDYPYLVLEGDAVEATQLTEALVRQNLQSVVKANSSSERDILPSSCRASAIDVSEVIADGDKAVVPADQDDDDFFYAFHDRQVGIALKVMRSQLRSVVGFTFGTNESGDQDEFGPVLYVYVGISKTTGKLVAIMTEAVYT